MGVVFYFYPADPLGNITRINNVLEAMPSQLEEAQMKLSNVKHQLETAKAEVEDVLKGLNIGADDYMKKPFDPRELLLRIKKILERNKKEEKSILNYREIEIDKEKYVLKENGEEIELSKKEFDLTVYLIENKGIVLSRDKILNKVWQSNYYSGDRSVDVYIGKLREKVKTLHPHIKTIKGVGYRLEEEK